MSTEHNDDHSSKMKDMC